MSTDTWWVLSHPHKTGILVEKLRWANGCTEYLIKGHGKGWHFGESIEKNLSKEVIFSKDLNRWKGRLCVELKEEHFRQSERSRHEDMLAHIAAEAPL